MLEDERRRALLVGGVVQSVSTEQADADGYWWAMLPDGRPRRALLLGAGGGTLADLLLRRFQGIDVVAIEDDPAVVALGRAHFYLARPGVQVILADAFAFAASSPGRFDYIAVDLFRGGARPAAVAGRPFLGDLRRLCAGRGEITVNLFRDGRLPTTLARLARALGPARTVEAGLNVVAHFRVRE